MNDEVINNIKFKDRFKIIVINFFFISYILFEIVSFIIFRSFSFSFIPLVFFSSITGSVEFKSDKCYIVVPPFLKREYKVTNITVINFQGIVFIKCPNPIYKLPFHPFILVSLGRKKVNELAEYANYREDIKYNIYNLL